MEIEAKTNIDCEMTRNAFKLSLFSFGYQLGKKRLAAWPKGKLYTNMYRSYNSDNHII